MGSLTSQGDNLLRLQVVIENNEAPDGKFLTAGPFSGNRSVIPLVQSHNMA